MRRKGSDSSTRRFLGRALAWASALALAGALAIAFASPASSHEVSGISANCSVVTVQWSGFPQTVPVHIAVQVGAVGSTSADVMVGPSSTSTDVDISALTAQLNGATADVVVDVTWTFEGPQHVHQSLQVTCGTATTTTTTSVSPTTEVSSTTASTTTTTTAGVTTTTTAGATTSSTSTTPTTQVGGENATTSTTQFVSGVEVTPPSTAFVSAASATGGSGTLPRTGGSTAPLSLIGGALLAAGAAFALAPRKRTLN